MEKDDNFKSDEILCDGQSILIFHYFQNLNSINLVVRFEYATATATTATPMNETFCVEIEAMKPLKMVNRHWQP